MRRRVPEIRFIEGERNFLSPACGSKLIESADEFAYLARSGDPDEFRESRFVEAPLEVWLDVIKRYPDLRKWVVLNKTVPVEALRMLSKDGDPAVRAFVAQKRKLPEDLQLDLANDPDAGVRQRLVWNAKVSQRVLTVLQSDSDEWIRYQVAERLSRRGQGGQD
jgi:hypothetical protein